MWGFTTPGAIERATAAVITSVVATGWLGARLVVTNAVADAADHLGAWSLPASSCPSSQHSSQHPS